MQGSLVDGHPYENVCSRCLTFGLPREGENNPADRKKEEKFDEKAYQRYEDIRSKMNIVFDDAAEIHKSKIQVASVEEVRRSRLRRDTSPTVCVSF